MTVLKIPLHVRRVVLAMVGSRLNNELVNITRDATIQERFLSQGIDPRSSTPEEFARFIRADIVKYAKLVKASGAKVD